MDNESMTKLFEKLYILQQGGEFINQGAVMVAMMLRTKVTKPDGTETNLWDSFEVKDDALVFKHTGADYDSFNKQLLFAGAVTKVNKEIHGDYDTLNKMMAKKELWGRVIMMFRTWMPQAIKTRLGSRYRDYQLSDFKGEDVMREGRWRTLGRAFFKTGSVSESAANISKFFLGMMLSTFSNKAGKKMVDGMVMDSVDRANMYVNLKEAWLLMMFQLISLALMYSFKDDEDEEEDSIKMSLFRYIYNQTSRVENELWFFYDPVSFTKIFRDAIPMWATIEQSHRVIDAAKNFVIDNEADTYKRGFRKGTSKLATQLELFLPVLRQPQNIWSMYSQLYSDNAY